MVNLILVELFFGDCIIVVLSIFSVDTKSKSKVYIMTGAHYVT